MKFQLLSIELTREFLLKFLKFGVVGFSGVFVNFGVTYVCKEWLKWNKYLSNILGFIVAATSNYILNRLWTFQSSNPQIGVEYAKYFGIALVGMGLDTLTVYVLNGKLKWNFYLSKVCGGRVHEVEFLRTSVVYLRLKELIQEHERHERFDAVEGHDGSRFALAQHAERYA